MKKLKIMLMSMAVLAVVSGALAFKAKKFAFVSYCTTVQNGGAACPIPTNSTTTAGTGTARFKWTITNGNPDDPCANAQCAFVSSFTKEP